MSWPTEHASTDAPDVRRARAFAAARARRAETEVALRQVASDAAQPAIVRASAIRALARFATPDSSATTRAIATAARDGAALVRMAAAGAASALAPANAVRTLGALLHDARRAVRSEAARSLGPLIGANPDAPRAFPGSMRAPIGARSPTTAARCSQARTDPKRSSASRRSIYRPAMSRARCAPRGARSKSRRTHPRPGRTSPISNERSAASRTRGARSTPARPAPRSRGAVACTRPRPDPRWRAGRRTPLACAGQRSRPRDDTLRVRPRSRAGRCRREGRCDRNTRGRESTRPGGPRGDGDARRVPPARRAPRPRRGVGSAPRRTLSGFSARRRARRRALALSRDTATDRSVRGTAFTPR